MRSAANSFLVAVQFMTRLPVPGGIRYSPDALAKSAIFFPAIGLLVGAGGAALYVLLSPHACRDVVVVLILVYLVTVTGGLHEDALADAADGFGGGREKDRVLAIMRDSRLGSFGTIAIALGLLARFVFLANLAPGKFIGFLIAGQVLGRWTALPLAFFLPSARDNEFGQGKLIAHNVTAVSVAAGTLLALAIVAIALRAAALWATVTAAVIAAASGFYYRRRIGGITGDCLGATTQLTEIAIYLMGAILP
jgi:adenosylcobinamide-GDP ribazoletransferase